MLLRRAAGSVAAMTLGIGLALTAGCNLGSDDSVTCSKQAVSGLRVTVVNGVGSGGQCDATVWAIDGSYSEKLECGVDQLACACSGAAERPGAYQVTATRSDGATATKDVTVGENECHVVSEHTTLELP